MEEIHYLDGGQVRIARGCVGGGYFFGYAPFINDGGFNSIGMLDVSNKVQVKQALHFLFKNYKLDIGKWYEYILESSWSGKKEIINFIINLVQNNVESLRIKNIDTVEENLLRLYITGQTDLAETILKGLSKNKRRNFVRTFSIGQHRNQMMSQIQHYLSLKIFEKYQIVVAGNHVETYKLMLDKFVECFTENEKKTLDVMLLSE